MKTGDTTHLVSASTTRTPKEPQTRLPELTQARNSPEFNLAVVFLQQTSAILPRLVLTDLMVRLHGSPGFTVTRVGSLFAGPPTSWRATARAHSRSSTRG